MMITVWPGEAEKSKYQPGNQARPSRATNKNRRARACYAHLYFILKCASREAARVVMTNEPCRQLCEAYV